MASKHLRYVKEINSMLEGTTEVEHTTYEWPKGKTINKWRLLHRKPSGGYVYLIIHEGHYAGFLCCLQFLRNGMLLASGKWDGVQIKG